MSNEKTMSEELAAAKAEISECKALMVEQSFQKERLREALQKYGNCTDDCACCPQVAGEPTSDGSYRVLIWSKWYRTRPIDERPKCNCGYQSALEVGNYPHTHDCENKWSAGFPCAHGGKERNA